MRLKTTTMLFIISISVFAQQKILRIELIIPDTIYYSNLPDSFAIKVTKLAQGELEISSPKHINNLRIVELVDDDTIFLTGLSRVGMELGDMIVINTDTCILRSARDLFPFLDLGVHFLIPYYRGFVINDYADYTIPFEMWNIFCEFEPKKIVVLDKP